MEECFHSSLRYFLSIRYFGYPLLFEGDDQPIRSQSRSLHGFANRKVTLFMLGSPSFASERFVTLVFRGQSRLVPLDHFCVYSTDLDPPARIDIDSLVSPEAFDQFATTVEGGDLTITRETAADLGQLFAKCHMPELAGAITRWIGSHTNDMLIPTALAALAEEGDCSAALSALSANLSNLLDDPLLLKLPLSALRRVLDSRTRGDDERRIFAFLLRALDCIGPAASILFVGLDFSALAATELLELLDRPSFIWEFVADAVAAASNAAKTVILADDAAIDRALTA
jgi:hypothetical protein